MANVCTVYLRVFPAPGRSLIEGDAEKAIWATVLEEHGSYDIEPRTFAAAGGALDLSYGRKWGPGDDAERVLFEHSDRVDAVSVRYACEGDEPDAIQRVDEACDRLRIDGWRQCRYAYDDVVVEMNGGEVVRAMSAGTYSAQNLRNALGGEFVRSGVEFSWASSFAADGMLRGIVGAERLEHARKVECFFRGRLVHRAVRASVVGGWDAHPPDDGFVHWALDGWDNCVDQNGVDR